MSKKEENMKKTTIIILTSFFGIGFVLPFAILLGYVIIDAVFFPAPSMESLLSQRLGNYDYFFADRNIEKYYFDKELGAYFKTTIAQEKIPELLEGNIFKVCADNTAICSDPAWSESDKSEYEIAKAKYKSGEIVYVDLWEYTNRTFEPGEYCATAEGIVPRPTREIACVNTNTGVFAYRLYD